jgi:hypothetical protein
MHQYGFQKRQMIEVRRKINNMPVMPAKCATCPFGEDGDRELRQRVESRLLQASQICHHPRLHGKRETHLCRGGRDVQLQIMYQLRVIAAPTDEAWAEKWNEVSNAT